MSGDEGGRRGDDRSDPPPERKDAPQGKERLPEDAEKLGYGSNARMPEEEAPENYRPRED